DAGVPRAPHAAVHGAEVERGRVAGDSGHGQHAAAAVRADEAPPERAVRVRRDGLGGCRDPDGQGDRERGEQRGGSDLVHGREDTPGLRPGSANHQGAAFAITTSRSWVARLRHSFLRSSMSAARNFPRMPWAVTSNAGSSFLAVVLEYRAITARSSNR